jgi:hypothetical protein
LNHDGHEGSRRKIQHVKSFVSLRVLRGEWVSML